MLNRDQRPGSFHPMQKHLHVSPSRQCTAGRREELLSFEGLTLLMHLLGVFSHLLRKTLSRPTNKELTKHQFLEMFGFYNYVMMDWINRKKKKKRLPGCLIVYIGADGFSSFNFCSHYYPPFPLFKANLRPPTYEVCRLVDPLCSPFRGNACITPDVRVFS